MPRFHMVTFTLLALLPACVQLTAVNSPPGGSPSSAASIMPSPAVTPKPHVLPTIVPSASASPLSREEQLRRECSLYDAALATITGRISDESGTPLSGVSVTASIPGAIGGDPCMPETVGKDAVWRGTTDKDGLYKLERTKPGIPLLLVISRGGKDMTRWIVQPAVNLQGNPKVNQYDITLSPNQVADPTRVSLAGVAYDRTLGETEDGVTVTATLQTGLFANGSDTQTVISGPFGRYQIEGVPLDSQVTLLAQNKAGSRMKMGPKKPLESESYTGIINVVY